MSVMSHFAKAIWKSLKVFLLFSIELKIPASKGMMSNNPQPHAWGNVQHLESEMNVSITLWFQQVTTR